MVSAEAIVKLPAVLKPVFDEQGGNAAVVLLLKPSGGDFDLLLVKRVENPSDTWSGQMALPGGKREPKDLSLRDTIVRETLEETGVSLAKCKFLGVLDAVRSEPKPDFKILPFVVLQLEEQKIKLNHELAGSFWVPLHELSNNNGTTKYGSKDYPAYVLKVNVIWGITYQLTNELVNLLEPFLAQ